MSNRIRHDATPAGQILPASPREAAGPSGPSAEHAAPRASPALTSHEASAPRDLVERRTPARRREARGGTDLRAGVATSLRPGGVAVRPRPAVARAVAAPDPARVTRALARQLPTFSPRAFEPGTAFWRVSVDPAVVEFAAMHFAPVARALAEHRGDSDVPFFVDRFHTAQAITLAKEGEVDPSNPRALALQQELRRRYGGLADEAALRSNCYAYALGDLTNPIGVGAEPGHRGLGGVEVVPDDAATLVRGAVFDGLSYAGTDPRALQVPPGKRLVMLYVSRESNDYHWERLDRGPDGGLQASGKFGMEHGVHVTDVEDVYRQMAWDFGHGYRFKAFFFAPEDGLDVGLDAHFRAEGTMATAPVAVGGELSGDAARTVDAEYLRALVGAGGER